MMYYPYRNQSNSEWAIPHQTSSWSEFTISAPLVPKLEKVDPNKLAEVDGKTVVSLRRHQEHAKARFRMLRRLEYNHDGEGAAAANHVSVDQAIAFIDSHTFGLPILPTLDDDGFAVIEIHALDQGVFADITFKHDGHVESYFRKANQGSEFFDGSLTSIEAKAFFASFDVR